MSCCPPSCAVPTCPSPCCSPCGPCCSPCGPCGYPVGGLGKLDCCPSSCSSSCCGCGTPARCLGITDGATVNCVTQLPPSEITIQPAPVSVVLPGPVLAATCESVKVGGYTACAGCPPCGCVCKPC